MNRGGLCDACSDPGHCCRRMFLSGGSGMDQVDAPMSLERAEHLAMKHSLPMRPLEQRIDGKWTWWCTALDPESGRCRDYENRPGLCRSFVEGGDPLCVHYVPPR